MKGWSKVPRREDYKPFSLGDTANLENEEWLKWREHGSHYNSTDPNDPYYTKRAYGGSAVASIFGLSHFTTKKELYDKKVGVSQPFAKKQNKEPMDLGHIYEPAIANVFGYWWKKYYPNVPCEIVNDTRMFRDGRKNPDGSFKYPWALVNLDRLIRINGEWGVLEIKRTSDTNVATIKNWEAGIVPQDYELQVRYYLAVMNLQFAYIICSWGHKLEQCAVVRIDRDYEIEEELFNGIQQFDDCIEYGIEPDFDADNAVMLNEYYKKIYGVPKGNHRIELPEKFAVPVINAYRITQELKALEQRKKELQEQLETVSSNLIPTFVGNDTAYGQITIDDEVYSIKLKSKGGAYTYDEERLKNDHPDIYSDYCKLVFDSTLFGKVEKKLATDYRNEKGIGNFEVSLLSAKKGVSA